MGIFDRLKRKKQETGSPVAEQKVETSPAREAVKSQKSSSMRSTRASQTIVRPILSEKGTHLAGSGKYVFAVMSDANKPEIKKDIERIYSVHVEKVRIVNMRAKKRRYGRSVGQTSEWKKAIVHLTKGEKIPGIIESVG